MSNQTAWDEIAITVRELRILKHTLGVDRYDRNDGRCPEEFYRNYFNAGTERHGDFVHLQSLESSGLMEKIERSADMGGLGFVVTDLGIKLVREVVGSLLKCECGADIVPLRECGCDVAVDCLGDGV